MRPNSDKSPSPARCRLKCHRQSAYTRADIHFADLLISITEWLGVTHYGNRAQTMLALLLKWLLNVNLPKNISRRDLGRDAFIDKVGMESRIWRMIYKQLQRLGASPDWDRERFTMDPLVRCGDQGICLAS